MIMIGLALIGLTGIVALVLASSRSRRPPAEGAGDVGTAPPRVSLGTEAVGYLGAVLVLAGAGAALARRWDDLAGWGRVLLLAAVAGLFLAAGLAVRPVREPAAQRLVDVLWMLAVAATGSTAGLAAADLVGTPGRVTCLVVGLALTASGLPLWALRRHALQNLAVLAGLVVGAVGAIGSIAGDDAPALAYPLALWPLGVWWALLGARGHADPARLSVAGGTVLALTAPFIAVERYGALYVLGVVTAAAAMAAAVRLRDPALLALGSVGLLAHLTSLVVRYLGDTFGVPATLAVTGGLLIVLAVVNARLLPEVRHGRPTSVP